MESSRCGSDKFVFPKSRVLVLCESLRDALKEPIEPLTPESRLNDSLKRPGKIISVGDFVTLTLSRHRIEPDVCVVDFRTRRGGIEEMMKKDVCKVGRKIVKVRNPAGEITYQLWDAVERALSGNEKTRIEVDGEEDLASLVALSLAPPGTAVIYGIPDMGIEIVRANEKTRATANEMLSKMTVR
jgi:GTP-dependent dephospho-CoA kinase